jgi:hypothetical protein
MGDARLEYNSYRFRPLVEVVCVEWYIVDYDYME